MMADWNERFQRVLEMGESTLAAANLKYKLLARLSVDFVEIAKTYGKVIISEHLLPDSKKTIKPLSLGKAWCQCVLSTFNADC